MWNTELSFGLPDVGSQWNEMSMAYEKSLNDLNEIDVVSDQKNENAVERQFGLHAQELSQRVVGRPEMQVVQRDGIAVEQYSSQPSNARTQGLLYKPAIMPKSRILTYLV